MASVESYQTAQGPRWRVRYRKPDRTQAAKRGFRTKRDAGEFVASVEVSKSRGEWVDPSRSRATVGQLASAWYAAQLQVKPTTLSGYRHNLDKHVLPRWAVSVSSTWPTSTCRPG